LKTPDDNKQNH